MELTNKQKSIRDRRKYVYDCYNNIDPNLAVSVLVGTLAKKYNVTDVQIYNDIKYMKEQEKIFVEGIKKVQ